MSAILFKENGEKIKEYPWQMDIIIATDRNQW